MGYTGQSGDPADARLASKFGGTMLITRKVAAAILGVDPKTLTRMREDREISGVRIATGEFRFSEKDIRAYLNRADRATGSDPIARSEPRWDPRMPNRTF